MHLRIYLDPVEGILFCTCNRTMRSLGLTSTFQSVVCRMYKVRRLGNTVYHNPLWGFTHNFY